MRRELFQPDFVIVMEAGFVVVDENGRGYVHCVGTGMVVTIDFPFLPQKDKIHGNKKRLVGRLLWLRIVGHSSDLNC